MGLPAGLLPARHRLLAWLLPGLLVACGGQSCTTCSGPLPPVQSPDALLLPKAAQVRITQHGFDVIAGHVVALLKALFGAGPGGVAQIDVAKLLGPQPLQFSGGLGLFKGKAGARDLVLTLDLASLKIELVEGSSPARIRIAFDHARIGVVKGVVFGAASFLGVESDAACHLHDGVDVGQPTSHLATLSAQLDVVLAVDAQGKLAVKTQVQQPVLDDIGFSLSKDCGLAECTDQVLLEDPCVECELCATGKLGSDAIAGVKDLLGPLMSNLLELVGNLLVQQVLNQALNGKPLDVEVPVELRTLLAQAAPLLGDLVGEPAGPLLVRVRPSAQAFDVQDAALRARMDASAFAKAHPCVTEPGPDAATAFAKLPEGPPPALPPQMQELHADGTSFAKPVDVALLLSSRAVEEAVWATLRSGLVCAAADSQQLFAASSGKLLVSLGALDVVMPGVRHLATAGAPIRVQIAPSALPEHAPLVHLAQEATVTVVDLGIRQLSARVEARVDGRWLTTVELTADVDLQAALQVIGGRIVLGVRKVDVPKIAVGGDPIAPYANWQALAPAVAKLAVALLLAQPLQFDVDVQQALAAVVKLPISADLVGVQSGGPQGDWLVLGIALGDTLGGKAGAP